MLDISFFQFAFPYSYYCPATRFKQCSYVFIMLNVSLALLLPIILMISRPRVSTIMTVPKTTVYENRYLFIKKNEIWVSFYRIVSPPTDNPVLFEHFNQTQFCRLILF